MENSILKIFANYYASDRCYDDSDVEESACNAAYLGLILGWKDPLEKGMATHSSILAWRILKMEETGRL